MALILDKFRTIPPQFSITQSEPTTMPTNTRHSIACPLTRKPLVRITATALISLAAGHAHAIACGTTQTISTTETTPVALNCVPQHLTVTSGGVLNVAGGTAITTSGETSHVITNSGSILGNLALGAGVSGDTRTVTNNGTLIGGIDTGAGVITYLTNSGTFVVKSGGTLGDIAGPTGAGGAAVANLSTFIQTSGGTLRIFAESAGEVGVYSYLNVSGEASLDGTLNVDVKTVNTLAIGQEMNVVRAGGGIVGQFSAITDNSALFNFTQRIEDNVGADYVFLDVVRAMTAEEAARSNGNTPGTNAARVIDTSPGMAGVLGGLGQYGTTQEVSNGISQTLPLLTGGSSSATRDALGDINQVIQSHNEGNQGLSSGDDSLGDRHLWLKPFGAWTDQGNAQSIPGYDARTYGMAVGIDGATSSQLRLGAAFAYANIDINSASHVAPQSSTIDIFQLIGYGSYSLDERTEVNVQLDGGVNTHKGQRKIFIPGFESTAKSDYDSWSVHAGAGLGQTYPLDARNSLTASLRADYTYISEESYTEKGAGVLNLHVKSRDADALVLGVQGKLTHALDTATQLTATLGVGYDVLNDRTSIVSAFAGDPTASFTTRGMESSPWIYRAGLGLVHKTETGIEITARYGADMRSSNFLNQTASVKFRWLF